MLSYGHIMIRHACRHHIHKYTNHPGVRELSGKLTGSVIHGLAHKLFTVLPSQADSEPVHIHQQLKKWMRKPQGQRQGKHHQLHFHQSLSGLSGHPAALMTSDRADLGSANPSTCENIIGVRCGSTFNGCPVNSEKNSFSALILKASREVFWT